MADQQDFDGDQCMVLPSNFLSSAEAVADIYEEELSAARNGFEIEQFSRRGFFKGSLLVAMIWAASGIWTVCH